MHKPITSRLRANKQIKKDPNAQPILHVGEVSPLKQVVDVEQTTKGEDKVVKQKTAGDILETDKAISGGEAGSGYDNKMVELLSEGRTYEQLAEAGHGTVSGLQDRFPGYADNTGRGPDKEVETTVPGEDITKTFTPKTQDSTGAITPWENRWNMRTARQSERFVRNEAKADLKRQAKYDARKARQEGMSYAESRKLKRDIRKGKDPKYQDLYDTSMGVTPQAQETYSSDAQRAQFNQAKTQGENVTYADRKRQSRDYDEADLGTSKAQTELDTVKSIVGSDSKTKVKSPAPMLDREMRAVGIKKSSPMKKGYFKNK